MTSARPAGCAVMVTVRFVYHPPRCAVTYASFFVLPVPRTTESVSSVARRDTGTEVEAVDGA